MAILASLMADCETILAAADALQKASFTGLKTETVQGLDRIDQLSTARVRDLSRAALPDWSFQRTSIGADPGCASSTARTSLKTSGMSSEAAD